VGGRIVEVFYDKLLNVEQAHALEVCNSRGMTLASIRSRQESQIVLSWLTGLRKAAKEMHMLWFGLVCGLPDGKECKGGKEQWTWTSGSTSTFDNWAPGEPTPNTEEGYCTQLYADTGTWNNLICTVRLQGFLCETGNPMVALL
jgi:hypothetical protein